MSLPPAPGDRVLYGEVLQIDGAVEHEQPAISLRAVQRVAVADDVERRAVLEVDRRQVGGQRDALAKGDRVGRVGRRLPAAVVDGRQSVVQVGFIIDGEIGLNHASRAFSSLVVV
jgi:hypothetical protein